MGFVFIGLEWDDIDGDRGRAFDGSLEILGVKCHVLGRSSAVWKTEWDAARIAEHILASDLLRTEDRLVVAPLAEASDGGQSWVAVNPLSASKCFNF